MDGSHALLFKSKLIDPPLDTSNYDNAVREHRKQIRSCRETIQVRKKLLRKVENDPESTADQWRFWTNNLTLAEKELEILEDDPPKKPQPPSRSIEQLSSLPR